MNGGTPRIAVERGAAAGRGSKTGYLAGERVAGRSGNRKEVIAAVEGRNAAKFTDEELEAQALAAQRRRKRR
ncbi:hypothetical protein KCP75_18945 [Salmonella enterica subsp. enterica]|nr:hypothetical protein KCP75_18945 [Salmonella enterica subsp. enterica]